MSEKEIRIQFENDIKMLYWDINMIKEAVAMTANMAKRKMNSDRIIENALNRIIGNKYNLHAFGHGDTVSPMGTHLGSLIVNDGKLMFRYSTFNPVTGVKYSNEWYKCHYNNANNYYEVAKLL